MDLPTVIQLVCPEIFEWNDHIFSAAGAALSELVDSGTLDLPLVAHKFKPRHQFSQLLNLVTVHSFVCVGHVPVCIYNINSVHWHFCSKSKKKSKKKLITATLACVKNISRNAVEVMQEECCGCYNLIYSTQFFSMLCFGVCSVNFSYSLVINSMMAKTNVWAQLLWGEGAFFGWLLSFGR